MSSVKDTKSEESLDFIVMWPILQQMLGIKTQEDLASKLDIQAQAVSNAKKKGQMPIKWIHRLAQKNLIPWDRIPDLMQKGPPAPGKVFITESTSAEKTTGTSMLTQEIAPEIPVGYCGGLTEKVGRYRIVIELLQGWVDETFPVAQRPGLCAWVVDEDNMEPTIPRKAFVLIDTQDRNLQAKGIFAFKSSNHMTLFRTFPHGDNVNIDLVNDNRAYPSTFMPEKILMEGPGPLQVAGRVIFKGSKI